MRKKIMGILLAFSILIVNSIAGMNVIAANVMVAGEQGTSQVELTVSASTFNVTVPTMLPISVDANGVVTTATDTKIVNNSQSTVKVTSINIIGSGGWSIVDYATDMSKEKVGERKLGFSINSIDAKSDGSLIINSTNFPVIDGKNANSTDELALVYTAKVPAQKEEIPAGTKIADVVFTIGWDE